jgi:hypothetical protein
MAGAACIQSARPLYAIFSRVNAQSFKCPLPGGTQCHKVGYRAATAINAHLYQGLALADSVIVDPHKWLGAPVGIGATFVRDRSILNRAFSQGAADYLEGACHDNNIQNSMQSMGVPYHDLNINPFWAWFINTHHQGIVYGFKNIPVAFAHGFFLCLIIASF